MAKITGDQVNQALGTFFQTFGAVKGLMEDRAHRLAWQEAQPQIEAQLQEQFTLLQEADTEAQAAKTPEERAAAMDKKMGAMKQYVMQSTTLAARLAASGNPYAQKYGASLQESTGMAVQQEFQGAKLQLDRQAQDQQFKIEKMRNDHQMQQEKLHSDERIEDKRLDAARYKESIGFRTKQEEIEGKVRERNDVLRGMQIETEKLHQQQLIKGDKKDPRKEFVLDMEAADYIDNAVKTGQITPEDGDQRRRDLGLPEKRAKPEYASTAAEKKLKAAEELERKATPAQRERARALLDTARDENKAALEKDNEFDLRTAELKKQGKTWLDAMREEQPEQYQKMMEKMLEDMGPGSLLGQ
jgi:hypothetical protein